MRVVLFVWLMCTTLLFCMDELDQAASIDMHDPKNNALILSQRNILEFEDASNVLAFYQEQYPEEYE